MDTLTDQQLLREYAERRHEAAFAELVRRHVDFVYSAAIRMVRDPHIAEDVTQGVFVALAQNAASVSGHSTLSGWLHRTCRNLAANVIRTDSRRRTREQEVAIMNELLAPQSEPAWEQIAPHLDDALAELNDSDRDALFLRYFERKSAHEIAQALGTTDDAAQKRVNRAVERLREFLSKRGVAAGAGGLAAVVSANAVQAAPAGLAATISTAGAGISVSTAVTTTKAIAMTTLQKLIVTAIVAAGVATPLFIQHNAQTKLRVENQLLRQQLKQETQLAAENERLASLLEQISRTNTPSLPQDQFNELLRLRGEVGRLRAETKASAQSKTAAENQSNPLRAKLEQMPDKSIPELQLLDDRKWDEDAAKKKLDTDDDVRDALAGLRRAAKIRFAFQLAAALNDFSAVNNGQLPADLLELNPYLKLPADEQSADVNGILQRYELLHTGKLADVPADEPLAVEKAPVDDQYDTLFKIGANWYTVQGVGNWANQSVSTNAWNTGAGSTK